MIYCKVNMCYVIKNNNQYYKIKLMLFHFINFQNDHYSFIQVNWFINLLIVNYVQLIIFEYYTQL